MGHEARLFGKEREKVLIHLGGVDRGEAQARQRRHGREQAPRHLAQGGLARQVGAVGGEVDAREHDLSAAARHQAPYLLGDPAHGHAAARAAAEGDDAEGAAVVASVLDLDEGAGAAVETLDRVSGRLPRGADIADEDAGMALARAVARRVELLGIAEHLV